MNLVRFENFSKIFAVEGFSEEYIKLLKKSGSYETYMKKLKFNLNILENSKSIEVALLHKNIEKLNDVPNLYSIRNISGLNPRTLFCYALDDDIYILLNSFLEKSSSDYKKGIEKAKNIINELGL